MWRNFHHPLHSPITQRYQRRTPTETSPSSSASHARFDYDVFLSFHGETCRTLTDHLLQALMNRGIRTFCCSETEEEKEEDQEGNIIEVFLREKIEKSEVFIPIFSEHYAESKRRLREISEMVRCNRCILPIFYNVEPRDVRRQTGPFSEPFHRHAEEATGSLMWGRRLEDDLSEWKEALRRVGSIAGYEIGMMFQGFIPKSILTIVKTVLSKLSTRLDVAKHPVGLGSRVQEVIEMLNVGEDDVRMIGIWGMAGIGKTTLAKAVYNEIYPEFESRSFIPDVREIANTKGIPAIQNQLIRDILNIDYVDVGCESRGITVIQDRCNKKVLIVLDGVGSKEQLDSLARERNWFQPGSRIIITSTDRFVFSGLNEDEIYQVKELNPHQSLKLFTRHVFGKNRPDEEYTTLLKKFVSATCGLPLAIEAVSSSLVSVVGRDREEWEEILTHIERLPQDHVYQRLKSSYDSLNDTEKNIFLDIACIMDGMDRNIGICIWDGCGFLPRSSITSLQQKSLVEVNKLNCLQMHRLLKAMGRRIVREENKEFGQSRLWVEQEVLNVLIHPPARCMVEAIRLSRNNSSRTIENNKVVACTEKSSYKSKENHESNGVLCTKSFAPLWNLRLLAISNYHLSENYEGFPQKLKWFEWQGCPLAYIPNELILNELAFLDLSNSNIIQVCHDKEQRSGFEKLKVLDLRCCVHLRTPNFSAFPNLLALLLDGCQNLVELPHSIVHLKCLMVLRMRHCTKLKEIPEFISQLAKLSALELDDCISLERMSDCIHKLLRIKFLSLKNCITLKELPISLFESTSLESLDLSGCYNMEGLSTFMTRSSSLIQASFAGCSKLADLPDCISTSSSIKFLSMESCRALRQKALHTENIEVLRLCFNARKELPDYVSSFKNLRELNLCCWSHLTELPDELGNLQCLEILIMRNTAVRRLPNSIGTLKMLKTLNVNNCFFLSELPDSIGDLESLRELHLRGTTLTKLPDSMGRLTKLKVLDLSSCRFLEALPPTGGNLNLNEIYLDDTSIVELPESFISFGSLQLLGLRRCKKFKVMDFPEDHRMEDLQILSDRNENFLQRWLTEYRFEEKQWSTSFVKWLVNDGPTVLDEIQDPFSGCYPGPVFVGSEFMVRNLGMFETEGAPTVQLVKDNFIGLFHDEFMNCFFDSEDLQDTASSEFNLIIGKILHQWAQSFLPAEIWHNLRKTLTSEEYFTKTDTLTNEIQELIQHWLSLRHEQNKDREFVQKIVNLILDSLFFCLIGVLSNMPPEIFEKLSVILNRVDLSEFGLDIHAPEERLPESIIERNHSEVVLKAIMAMVLMAHASKDHKNKGLLHSDMPS